LERNVEVVKLGERDGDEECLRPKLGKMATFSDKRGCKDSGRGVSGCLSAIKLIMIIKIHHES
jgi:hypothetical protein